MVVWSGSNWQDILQALPAEKIVSTLRRFAFSTSLLLVVMLICEAVSRVDLRRYLTRNFGTDLLYRFFYNGGIYMGLLYGPLAHVVRPHLAFLDLGIVHRMPLAAGLLTYWLTMDFLNYWTHRFQHTRYWWRFHSIHHSQTMLTFTSSHRFHVLDQLLAHAVAFLPVLILGAPVVAWLPYSFLLSFIDATHHSGLTWTLGPLRHVLVSPIFHTVHHSTDAAHCHRNYSGIFSFWDHLFGTGFDPQAPPTRLGIVGWEVPESFLAHFLAPFRRAASTGAIPPRPE